MSKNKKLTLNCMDKQCKYTSLLGRILISAIFINGGIMKILGFAGVVSWTGSVLPYPELMVVLAIIVELGAGLGVLFGIKARWSALALAIYLLVVTIAFHLDFGDQNQVIQITKNAAIAGGLLILMANGPGKFSVNKD